MSARWDLEHARKIVKRLVITADLELCTPARFGGGQERPTAAHSTDMPLARDPHSGDALLSGASIAGALRAYLREREMGYEQPLPPQGGALTQQLFGDVLNYKEQQEERKESRVSWLVIDDAYARPEGTETRPGVAIDAKERTAKKDQQGRGFLYDYELLPAGTKFALRFELALPDDTRTVDEKPGSEPLAPRLLQGLAVALTGLENGEIGLGTRKRRGLGECIVKSWKVEAFDLKTKDGLLAWLQEQPGDVQPAGPIAAQLGFLPSEALMDRRRRFTLSARFLLKGSLLIRSGSDKPDAPDMQHLKSQRLDKDGKPRLRPVLSGTSLAGVLRARARRIALAAMTDEDSAKKLVDDLFGPEGIGSAEKRTAVWASRISVREREITDEYEQVQSRVRIDRFTGGTLPGALFDQQPVSGNSLPDSDPTAHHLTLDIELRKPTDAQIGLLLHLLKDLWTGDLPLGGESSVGRGRLQGVEARLTLHTPDAKESWQITAQNPASALSTPDGLAEQGVTIVGDVEKLENFARMLGGEA